MFVNYTDTLLMNRVLVMELNMKFIMSNSDIAATLILIFPDYDTFKRDDENLQAR